MNSHLLSVHFLVAGSSFKGEGGENWSVIEFILMSVYEIKSKAVPVTGLGGL
jgi:hypothetical protein